MIGNEGSNKGSFIAETEAEESLMLMGKLNALEGVLRWNPELINADMVNALFGFNAVENEELKSANVSIDYWYRHFAAERDRADGLLKQKNELQAKLDELMGLKGKKEEKEDDTV